MSEENSVIPSSQTEISRNTLIDSLSKGNPRIRQWLDSLAIATIQTLTPENVDLASSVFFPATSSEETTMATPATSTVTQTQVTSGLQGASSLPLPGHPSLTTEVVTKLLSLTDQSKRLPAHFIKPPSSFGQSPMTSEDELRLSSLRKDTKSSATLEFTLRFLNTFCEARPHISEKAILDVLHTFLPLNTLEAVEYIRMKRDASLHLVYSYLQTHFGNVRSRAEVFQSLSILTSSIGDLEPMQVLDRISKLLLQVSESEEECEMAALRDSLSYLRLLLGYDTFLTLKMYLQEGNFSALYTICKCHYAEILLSRWKEKRAELRKVRQITHPLHAEDDVHNPSTRHNAGQLENILRQILGKSNVPLSCFRCGDGNHLVSDCPQPFNSLRPKQNQQDRSKGHGPASRTSSKPLTRQPYSSMPCSLHKSGKNFHLNSECFTQQRMACHVHPNAHSAASCTRMEFPPSPSTQTLGQPRSGQPQPLFPQYQQFPGQPTYPHPPHPQQQRFSPPARAHHVSHPATPTRVQPSAPASTTQDSFDLDSRTKEALIAALTALTNDE